MAAVIAKNELVAAKRQCDLIVYSDGALTLAPRTVNFVALGALFVTDPANPQHWKLGTGTCVNKRKPLTFTSFTFTADSTTDKLNKVAHGLNTGDGPIGVSNAGGGLPAGLVAATDYWVIKVDADNFYLATSVDNAYAGTRIDITTNGTGTQTAATRTGCSQGIDGFFAYQFTQAETAVDVSELSVFVDGTGYARANNGGTYTTVNMGAATSGFEATSGDGISNQSKLNLIVRTLVAKFAKVGSVYTFRDLLDSKDSHSGTVVAGGRTTSTIIDAT